MKSNASPSARASAHRSAASCPFVRNRRSGGSPVTRNVTGSVTCSRGNPLPGADQRVPGTLPDIGQVHRVHAVGDPAGAPHVLPLDAGRGGPLLLLPCLIQDPGPQPARPAVPPGGPVQPGRGEPAHDAHRRLSIPAGMIQQPLRPVRRRVPAEPGDAPPVPLRQVAHHRRHVFARLQPHLRPREARPQRLQQARPFPQRRSRAYPDGSSRLRFSCHHKHMDRQAAAPLCPPSSSAGQALKCGCRTSEAPPLTAEICGSAGAPVRVGASWPS